MLNFHIEKDYRTIQEIEKDFDYKIRSEKVKHREKELETKHTIKNLMTTLEKEKDKRLQILLIKLILRKSKSKQIKNKRNMMLIFHYRT